MKIIFIGAVTFSEKLLEHLILLKADIVGVITTSEKKQYSDYSDLSSLCKKNNISLIKTNDINSKEIILWAREKKPDLIFCFGWNRLLKEEILSIPPKGVIGYHPAKIPKNRGRHPIIWALVLGLKETGSSFFYIDKEADSGDIISQRKVDISESDNANSLYKKLVKKAQEQLSEFLPLLLKNKIKKKKQDLYKSNLWRKRGEPDGIIDWRMSSKSIYDLVRALSKPYIGAYFLYNKKKYIIWSVKRVSIRGFSNIEPGKVVRLKNNLQLIKCGEGFISIEESYPKLKLKDGEYL
ncbi:MAG: methionyl-tRNA formyltransferase [Flavobacteriaceae bacterium]|nr:methionyl-tRNA formyltransferase [Flavobacteriaceae bacterium]|tara:strand:- start:3542 stop:4426 length:885 start_codon:yes stop_codon:yes gene_type:complete